METLAILAAAGQGQRMGADRPKAFLDLAGESLLVRAARAFERAPSVDGIVAVVPEAELERAGRMLGGLSKLVGVVPGGPRRQDSVIEGLGQAPAGFDGVVLVHDVARALVDVEVIERVVEAARENGAALPVVSLADTVKRVRRDRVVETVDRSELGAAQTPQGFRFALLARACEEVRRQGLTVTDEASAVERLGETVTTVPGSERYRKITTPEDLAWAGWALTRHPEGEPA
jgi:2-C-methyl-D-erythritol 4-phosphate cytidylyltransferase